MDFQNQSPQLHQGFLSLNLDLLHYPDALGFQFQSFNPDLLHLRTTDTLISQSIVYLQHRILLASEINVFTLHIQFDN